jgi:hypothetical protein
VFSQQIVKVVGNCVTGFDGLIDERVLGAN